MNFFKLKSNIHLKNKFGILNDKIKADLSTSRITFDVVKRR